MRHVQQVAQLAELRRRAAMSADYVKAMRDEFERTIAPLVERAKVEKTAVEEAETALRQIALADYARTNDKKGIPGVEIKVMREAKIDLDRALTWAKEKEICLIPAQVDTKALIKVAAATPLPFVQFHDAPQAQLAKDLDKALAPIIETVGRDAVFATAESTV